MISNSYRSQVELLLKVLPYVSDQEVFALKGGTAINLFHRDMPRLSVDIDLTYLPVEDRKTALLGIADGLDRIKTALEEHIVGIKITKLPQSDGQEAKLSCRLGLTEVKIEVNTTIRGCLQEPVFMPASDAVVEELGLFAAINVVAKGELYGGKICAALDRQHPRDLFDIRQLLDAEGITEEIKQGFIAALVGHSRPIHELLNPNFQDQREAFGSQFEGMTRESFTYEDYEATRLALLEELSRQLTDEDRAFLISFKSGAPDWKLYPLKGIQDMSAVQWKLQNIRSLKDRNPEKHAELIVKLKGCLELEK